MPLSRRRFLQLTPSAAALVAQARLAKAQAYPNRPVRIIVGFGPGASGDIAARVLAQALTRLLAQQFTSRTAAALGA